MPDDRAIEMCDHEDLPAKILNSLTFLNKRVLKIDSIKQLHDIPISRLQILMLLDRNGSTTVSEISERFGIAKSNITPLIDRLIDENYVERVRSHDDLRIIYIRLKPLGTKRIQSIKSDLNSHFHEWLKQFPKEEQTEIVSVFCRFTKYFTS